MKIALALAAALLALSGCASTEEPTETADASIVSGDSNLVADNDLMEQVYLTNLRTEHPEVFMAVDDTDLLNLGEAICTGFEGGMTWAEASLNAINAGYTVAQGGWLLGSAITAFCPEYESLY